MKKIIILLLLAFGLVSCGREQTQQERLKITKECNELGFGTYLDGFGDVYCNSDKEDKVYNCIHEYTNGLDEKYNNPDTISNLKEDNYSQVVKTCNEIFGEKTR